MKLDRPGDVFADLPLIKNLEWQTDTNKFWLSICLRVLTYGKQVGKAANSMQIRNGKTLPLRQTVYCRL